MTFIPLKKPYFSLQIGESDNGVGCFEQGSYSISGRI
jgi:hypothetical protein